jgi:protein SCO1/2
MPIHFANSTRMPRRWLVHLFLLPLLCAAAWASDQTYSGEGMVLRIDPVRQVVVVSCREIPGYMQAMAMPLTVLDAKELDGLEPGTAIAFKLVVGNDSSHIEGIQIHAYQGLEVDPLTARRLKLLNQAVDGTGAHKPVTVGQPVPNFRLIDQSRRSIELSQFAGKVVALDFVYTRCALPDFCVRMSNNFASLQKRFEKKVGRDLILLTVTFDPVHDEPEVLRKYAERWKAGSSWHFLTGKPTDVQRVCAMFGVDAFQDEGLMNHSLHTAVIDRSGKLVANIEGNQFTAEQLGDLVETAIDRGR